MTDPEQVERLLRRYPAEAMPIYADRPVVNNTRHNGPALLEPE